MRRTGGMGKGALPSCALKVTAGVLLAHGIVGLGFAAATQLGTAWTGNFQAGAIGAETNCQPPDQPLVVSLTDPIFTGTDGVPWKATHVQFSDIDSQCFGLNYHVAFRTNGDWQLLESPTASGTVSGPTLTADLGTLELGESTEFALSISK